MFVAQSGAVNITTGVSISFKLATPAEPDEIQPNKPGRDSTF